MDEDETGLATDRPRDRPRTAQRVGPRVRIRPAKSTDLELARPDRAEMQGKVSATRTPSSSTGFLWVRDLRNRMDLTLG